MAAWHETGEARRSAESLFAVPAPPPSIRLELDHIDQLTLEEIQAELERLVERRFVLSQLSPDEEARYRALADRERALLLLAAS